MIGNGNMPQEKMIVLSYSTIHQISNSSDFFAIRSSARKSGPTYILLDLSDAQSDANDDDNSLSDAMK